MLLSSCSFNSVFFPLDERANDPIHGAVEPIQLSALDGTLIEHFLFKPTGQHKATIFAFHGSGSKVVNWYKVIKPLVDDGFQVFMMEYRGFGEALGEASHINVAQDASRALTYLMDREDVKNQRLLLLGQSYGGQVAFYLAHRHPGLVDAVITEGTFSSFSDEAVYSSPRMVRPLVRAVFKDPYSSKELIKNISVPILIIHSKDDKVVPFSMAETLFENAPGDKEFWEVQGKHVAALLDFPEDYVARVNKLFASIDD